jgi:hypothetical protein
MDHQPLRPNWMQIAKLVFAAPHATDEAEALLNRYDAGELPLEVLMDELRVLGAPGRAG